jgi:hypothetical protein
MPQVFVIQFDRIITQNINVDSQVPQSYNKDLLLRRTGQLMGFHLSLYDIAIRGMSVLPMNNIIGVATDGQIIENINGDSQVP